MLGMLTLKCHQASLEAGKKIEKYGLNIVVESNQHSILLSFLSRFKNPLVIILLFASFISASTGAFIDFTIILSIIIFSVVVSAGGGGGGGGGGSSPVCSPTSQTVTVGQTVNYSATGGNGAYSWQATSGSITSGTLASFSTSYATPGTYNVVLTSNGLQATCNAIVQAAPTGSLDLAVNKAVNNSTPVVGQQVTYTISLTNNSTVNATGVTVRDLLPTSVTYTSSFTTQGSYDNATGIWTIGSLPAGDSVSLLITVKVNVLGSIENTAAMTTVDQIDTNSGNNTSTVTITVNAAPSLPAAGANTTASILAGLLFMLLAFVARFFMQTTKATVVATTAESSIKTFTRFD
jgi:uncharacterized repeat protein (TIGR01451 family)